MVKKTKAEKVRTILLQFLATRSHSYEGSHYNSKKLELFDGLEKIDIPVSSQKRFAVKNPSQTMVIKGFDNEFFKKDVIKFLEARTPSPSTGRKFLPEGFSGDEEDVVQFKPKPILKKK